MQDFLWLANWPALDFVNTEIVRGEERVDLFRTDADVEDWLTAAGFLDLSSPSRAKGRLLEAARHYRFHLRNGLEQFVASGNVPETTITETNRLIGRSRFSLCLELHKLGFRLKRHWHSASSVDPVTSVALSFAELLSGVDLKRIRRCKNPECVLFFYDTSKSATRTWCSLDNCGNKLRMAAFRKRHSKSE